MRDAMARGVLVVWLVGASAACGGSTKSDACSGAACGGCHDVGAACTPANPCDMGRIACEDGGSACVDLGTAAPDGVTCDGGNVCTGGQCVAPCVPGSACTLNESCQLGMTSCPASSPSVCVPTTAMADGTSCGAGGVCEDGGCESQLALTAATGASAPPGSSFSGTLGTLTDLMASDTPSNLIASVDWGDNTTSAATVTGGAGSFVISGSHSFGNGLSTATVAVTDPATRATAQASVTITVGVSALAIAGRPTRLAFGRDGNLWVTLGVSNAVARVTPAGAVTPFTVPTPNAAPSAIVVGPDNNMWFTEQTAGQIGRITLDGTITEFSVPSLAFGNLSNFGRQAICSGPDGNIWFVEANPTIGRMTLDGVVTEFPVPTPSSATPIASTDLEGITPGPDGNLWFVEDNGGPVGSITPAGVITEFTLDPPANATFIIAGPDGNLWIAESMPVGQVSGLQPTPALQQMTTAGVMADRFSLPTNGIVLTTGPDGNIWLGLAEGKLGRMTTSGTLTLYPFSIGVDDLAEDPSGAPLWFTADENQELGSFSP
jgi:virginiamycin B lyase